MELTYDPAISLLGIYPKKLKILIQKNTCIPMFIAVLFAIAKIWKQPKCPSIDDWVKQIQYIYTTEYYSAVVKKKKITSACYNMDGPEECCAKLNKANTKQSLEKDKYHTISLTCGNCNEQNKQKRNKLIAVRGKGVRGLG